MHRPARGALRISARPATRPALALAFLHPRPYSVSATEPPPSLQPHQYTAFERLSTSLSLNQPCFGARGDEVELLTGPEVFYSRLLDIIKGAKRRILISSLYIGAEEGELVEAIQAALTNNPQLRVVFILDYHRATRLASSSNLPPSTAHLLLPLVERFSDRCEVWLFRSPKLKGLMEKIVPARYDEGWGTWHGKWYGADDEVIISGANLGRSYFTNRQDRYIHFRSNPSLLSYLSSLTRLFTQYSYLLHHSPPPHISPYNTVPLPSPRNQDDSKLSTSPVSIHPRASLIWPSPSINPRKFSLHALATLTAFQNSWRASNTARSRRVDVDTWFWPVLQAGVLGIKEEERAMAEVWKAVKESHEGEQDESRKVEVDLTSGYFGLYKKYKQLIVESPAAVRIIAASPKANGFYGSKGFSRLIPEGYTLLESRFHQDTVRAGRAWDMEKGTGVRLKEWERKGWTYHSKGLWVSPPNSKPFLTFVGSSNLSTRSLTLDTELSMVMMTSSPTLRRALDTELKHLDEYATQVGEDTWKLEERQVSWLAWLLVALGVEGML
ncbi:CDP-diacylglycerol-glycerol-3-phosphate 3-phosphatidyltransferase [Cryptococcus gattii EJB2]|uniref:CDP-diacylglycerol--glycerol-3-phosphate 3-phosphatidyltransferase n=1 Tax=Cryptococcus gattii EJB2 TaxID=1296103 RepID=A0ABR5C1A1_9TREE|nr:CDP-diacylglycerol-glycerol-3-phosphate 3-phosphatidyltransferase [Cryptococcus gattii EJB2]